MHRARRVALVAVLAVVGVAGLTGCRSQPTVAAYVGDTRITNRQVDRLAADAEQHARDEQSADVPLVTPSRDAIVTVLVMREIASRLAAEHARTPADVDRAAIARRDRVSAGSRYAALHAEMYGYLIALQQGRQAAQPTEADLRDMYARAVSAGLAEPGRYDDFAASIVGVDGLGEALAERNELADAARRYRVVVNPRYAPLEYPVFGGSNQQGVFVGVLVVPLGAAQS